jgi:hypothetical protein
MQSSSPVWNAEMLVHFGLQAPARLRRSASRHQPRAAFAASADGVGRMAHVTGKLPYGMTASIPR